MKQSYSSKIAAFVACTICVVSISFAQFDDEGHHATTETEYRYVSKGIKVQEESGLDMKKGYQILPYKDMKAQTRTNTNSRPQTPYQRSVEFAGLFRDGDEYPCAIIAIHRRNDTNHEQYFCIPSWSTGPEIGEAAYKDYKAYCKDSKWPAAQIDYMWCYMQSVSFAYSQLSRTALGY